MHYVIIGNGAAGYAAAKAIFRRDPGADLCMISDESHPGYYRPLIPAIIEESDERALVFREEGALPKRVCIRSCERVKGIDTARKVVMLATEETVPFDRLLIATGSSAIIPRIPGLEGEGVYVLRTVGDAEAIRREAEGSKRAVVLGGGRVGMKAALALRQRGLEVTVIEKMDRIVPGQFDQMAAEIIRGTVESLGIELVLGQTMIELLREGSRPRAVLLEDGRVVDADFVIVAVGVKPNTGLAEQAGLHVDKGIVVDDRMRTSAQDLFAAGDVVEMEDLATGQRAASGLWTNAVQMGVVAGTNMAEGDVSYGGGFAVLNSLELAGIPTVSVGCISPPAEEGYQIYSSRKGQSYRRLVLKDGRLVGALFVGEIEGAGVCTGLIRRGANVESRVGLLMSQRPSYAYWLRWEFPEAQVMRS